MRKSCVVQSKDYILTTGFSSEGVRCTLSGSLIAKPCTPEEVAFYESSALHPAFRELIPTYMGTLSSADEQEEPDAVAAARQNGTAALSAAPADNATSTEETKNEKWVPSGGKKIDTGLSIVLENVASGFKRPNVLDVKLGARLWADDAPPEKRAKLDAVSKETTSSILGFRIAGMKVWTGVNGESDEGGRTDPYETKHEGKEGEKGEVIEKDGYRRYDKWYGRSFNADNVKEGFETFLSGSKVGGVDHSKLVAKRLTDELRRVQKALESEESRMYSASVLIVYEGDPKAMKYAIDEEKKALENPAQPEEEDDEDEEITLEELQKDGSLEIVDIDNVGQASLAQAGISAQQAININVDPGTVQMASMEDMDDDDDDDESPPKVHDLRLIDFAHATWTPGQGSDENALTGVRSLIKIFDELCM